MLCHIARTLCLGVDGSHAAIATLIRPTDMCAQQRPGVGKHTCYVARPKHTPIHELPLPFPFAAPELPAACLPVYVPQTRVVRPTDA